MKIHNRALRNAGFTLVESMISLAILAIVMSSALTAVNSAQGSSEQAVTRSVLTAKTGRVLSKITEQLRGAGADALTSVPFLPGSIDQLDFRQATGIVDQAIVWSNQMVIRLEYMPGEIDNGLDDNGDGFVDECRIVRVDNPGAPDERMLVLGTQVSEFFEGETPSLNDDNGNGLVDERGLCFYRTGDLVTVLLTMLRRDSQGRVGTRSSTTTIALRN